MNTLLALLNGIISAIMNSMNALLNATWGTYPAAILIHATGLVLITLLCIGKFKSINEVPKRYILGGAIGLGTTVFCSLSAAALGVTLMLVLSLLGQTISSIVVDQFGLLGAKKVKINKEKVISICLIALGAVVMIVW